MKLALFLIAIYSLIIHQSNKNDKERESIQYQETKQSKIDLVGKVNHEMAPAINFNFINSKEF